MKRAKKSKFINEYIWKMLITIGKIYLLTLKNVLEMKKLHKFTTGLKTVTILGYKMMKMARKHLKYLNSLKFLLMLH